MNKSNIERRTSTTVDDLPETIKKQVERQTEDGKGNQEVKVFIGKKAIKPKEQFALAFVERLLDLTRDINFTDLKVLFCICKFVNKGNIVNLSQREVAATLGITQPMVSKAMKNLIKNEALIVNQYGTTMLNPALLCKESLILSKETDAYRFAKQLADNNGGEMPF